MIQEATSTCKKYKLSLEEPGFPSITPKRLMLTDGRDTPAEVYWYPSINRLEHSANREAYALLLTDPNFLKFAQEHEADITITWRGAA